MCGQESENSAYVLAALDLLREKQRMLYCWEGKEREKFLISLYAHSSGPKLAPTSLFATWQHTTRCSRCTNSHPKLVAIICFYMVSVKEQFLTSKNVVIAKFSLNMVSLQRHWTHICRSNAEALTTGIPPVPFLLRNLF